MIPKSRDHQFEAPSSASLDHDAPSRRRFLQATGAVAAAAWAVPAVFARMAHAGGNDVLRVGLIGCGGRGTGAAVQALSADPQARLTAMGDTFADRIRDSLGNLRPMLADKIDVTEETCFVGFDAYQKVIDSGVDVVLLCSPPHFRPAHFQAAVAAGKHIFAEKPVAVDASGVRKMMEAALESKRKGLSVVSGLCYRYEEPKRQVMQRIHDGDIGRILAMHVTYNTSQLNWHGRGADWTDMEWQVRNWNYFTWLSGDHNVEQHVHSLDKASWAMGDVPPISAVGLGGRQCREHGNVFDHHAVVYEYADGVKLFSFCRQQDGCAIEVSDYVLGTKGTADIMKAQVRGETEWRFRGENPNMYQVEHDQLFASIRSGNPINNSDYMITSTMVAILGRMATYTGQVVTWEQALASQEDFTPPAYEWGPIAMPTVAQPGITPLT
jgi:predicted dehydrogenase